MPIKHCEKDGKPGFSWGNTNKCWTYDPKSEASKKKAKANCIKQAIAIEGPDKFKKEVSKADIEIPVTKEEILSVELSVIFNREKASIDDTGKPYSDKCPECGQEYTTQCRCFIGNRTCANKHNWYHGKNGNAWRGTGHSGS